MPLDARSATILSNRDCIKKFHHGRNAMSMPAGRRKFFARCTCCSLVSTSPASPARRNFLAGGVAALGPGRRREPRPRAAGRRAGPGRQDPHRRTSPFHPAVPRRRHDGAGAAGRTAAAEMVARAFARGDGQERDRDLDPVDRAARGLVRQQSRGVAPAGAPAQRVRRQGGQGSSRPLRPVRRASLRRTSTAASRRSNTPSIPSRPTASAF